MTSGKTNKRKGTGYASFGLRASALTYLVHAVTSRV